MITLNSCWDELIANENIEMSHYLFYFMIYYIVQLTGIMNVRKKSDPVDWQFYSSYFSSCRLNRLTEISSRHSFCFLCVPMI